MFPLDRLDQYTSCESTNTLALQDVRNGRELPFAVTAEHQSAGRGRRGKSFFSPAQRGLYLSCAIAVDLPRHDAHLVTCGAAVVVVDAIKAVCAIDVQIKWVNDILLNNRKIAGILTEVGHTDECNHIRSAVIGIGINLSVDPHDFPDDIRQSAGSLLPPGRDVESVRNQLTRYLLDALLCRSENLSPDIFMPRYRAASMLIGRNIVVKRGNRDEPAQALSIGADGRLLIRHSDGTTSWLNSGEVSLVLQ